MSVADLTDFAMLLMQPHLMKFLLSCIFSLSLGLLVSVVSSTDWIRSSEKYYSGTFYTTYRRKFTLPQGAGGGGSTINVVVRAFRNGPTPQRCIFVIPGGPGQSGKSIAQSMTLLEGPEFRHSWVYVMDHRGVGLSSKISSLKRFGQCIEDAARCAAERTTVPIKAFSTANAVNDLIAIVEDTRMAHPGAPIHAIGISYGSYLLYQLLAKRRNLFGRVILADFIGSFKFSADTSHDISDHVMQNCHRNERCKHYFPHRDYPTQVMRVLSAGRNQCTKALNSHPKLGSVTAMGDFRMTVQMMVDYLLQAYRTQEPETAQSIVLYMLRQLEVCKDPGLFKSHLNSWVHDMESNGLVLANISSSSNESSKLVHSLSNNSDKVPINKRKEFSELIPFGGGNAYSSNLFINIYVNYSNLANTGIEACARARLGDLFNKCSSLARFIKASEPFFDKVRYTNDGGWDQKGISVDSTVFLLMGQVDVNTPYTAARRYFDAIKAPAKHVIVARNHGHGGVIDNSQCMAFRVLLGDDDDDGDGYVRKVKYCISSFNDLELTWMRFDKFDFEPVYSKLTADELGSAKDADDVDPNGGNAIMAVSYTIIFLLLSVLTLTNIV